MPFKPYRSESRANYGSDQVGNLSLEQLQIGALLRIADASESMAQEHNRLIASEKFERNRANRLAGEAQYLHRRVAALKGVITKMKAKEARNADS